MELRQLRYFVKAAETLNFSDAARVLNLAQSSLSQQIRLLEDELDVQLFERGSHSVSLTEAGRELMPLAQRTLYDASACRERIQDIKQLLTGTLNIGVTYSFSPVLTETLLEFMKQYPKVKLNICYRPMAELMDMLLRRTVDFVLAFRPTERCEGIESHTLFDNHLSVIVGEHHPLASKERVSPADIARYDMALPVRGLQARNALDRVMAPYMDGLRVRLELDEVNLLLHLVRRSHLVTVLAEATIYSESGLRALPLDLRDTEMDGCVHMLRGAYRKHSALEFIRMLKESNAVRERLGDWFR